MDKNVLWITLFFLFSSFVYADYNVTTSDATVNPGQTVLMSIETLTSDQKGDPYTYLWYNGTTTVDSGTGFLSEVLNGFVFETYGTSVDDVWTSSYFNITSGGITSQVFFNVTGNASNVLVIQDEFFSPDAKLGRIFAIDFEVIDGVTSNPLDNVDCIIYGTDSNDAPLQECTVGGQFINTFDGRGVCSGILNPEAGFIEGEQYLAKIRCHCHIGEQGCFDEDGTTVEKKSGSKTIPFVVSEWLQVNTLIDKTQYYSDQEIYICANVTNVDFIQRISIEIYHQIRCGQNDTSLFRALEISDDNAPDQRGISPNTTQNQCKRFIIPESKKLQGRTNTCYASTTTWVLNNEKQKILGYATTSPEFNITIEDINIDADWQFQGNGLFNSIINLSAPEYSEYRGEGVGQIDIRLDRKDESIRAEDQYLLRGLSLDNFLQFNSIQSVSVVDINGTSVVAGFEVLNDGNVEIELTDVDLTSAGYYDIDLKFNRGGVASMASLAVVGFLTLLTFVLFWLPMKFQFNENVFTNYVLSRMCMIVGLLFLAMTITAVASVSETFGIGVTQMMFTILFLVNKIIYVSMVFTLLLTGKKGLELWHTQKEKKRNGHDENFQG